MAGRKRKDGRRKPSGRLATPNETARVDEAKSVVLTQRYKRDRLAKFDRPQLEGPLGLALVEGIIDEHQRRAGDDYNALVRRYAGLKGIPMPTPRGQRFDPTFGVRLVADTKPETVRAIEETYTRAISALKVAGYTAIREVNSVCVHGEDVSAPHALRIGLDALIQEWSLRNHHPGDAEISRKIRKWEGEGAKPKVRDDLHEHCDHDWRETGAGDGWTQFTCHLCSATRKEFAEAEDQIAS